MDLRNFKIACLILMFISLFASSMKGQDSLVEKHIEVSLRMIGHQVLLNAGDSTSRVLPISRQKDQYKIQFESEFSFQPEELVSTINKVMIETRMTKGYFMEVVKCESNEVTYSIEIDNVNNMEVVPCLSRDQPKSCYSIVFTLIGKNTYLFRSNPIPEVNSTVNVKSKSVFIGIVVFLLLGIAMGVVRKKSKKPSINPDLVTIGKYHFDKIKSVLIFEKSKIELSGKETELLLLLYNAVNTTVDREVILNAVWKDEGDYVGRTLDVFISKLRKKLELDSDIKIVNIRGVGYKLIVDPSL